MLVETAKSKRYELEKAVLELFQKFERESSLKIAGVDLVRETLIGGYSNILHVSIDVNL